MAIFADYKKITTEYSEETELQTTTYPLDLGETNPDYNLRGQTVELEVPITTTTEEILENVYVQIISYMFYKRWNSDGDNIGSDKVLDLHYRIYNSKEQREADFNDFVFEEHILGRRIEENAGDDLRNLGYDLLKNEPIFSNCIDDL
mgnify:CR=1 FL=1|tara:strand:- start:322 stop:762 length:441 start_codon:yes stop_codon:yes gene_type:complete